jgi:hypothetical protein
MDQRVTKITLTDPFESNSVRVNDQLLEPGLYIVEDEVLTGPPNEDWRFDGAAERIRQAEGMVHYLLVQSHLPALLLDDYWTDQPGAAVFENETIFREVAAKSGCVIEQISRPVGGGMRHMLFLGRNTTVIEPDYMASIPERPTRIVTMFAEAKGGPIVIPRL